ncbi:MAG TPA: hypothetical protein VIU65_07780 [Pyrinomonadaceae bacterium]
MTKSGDPMTEPATAKRIPSAETEEVQMAVVDDPTPNLVTATSHPFSATTGIALEDMSTGTTQLVAANSDDGASAVTNIGFDYWYDGVRFTQFSCNANGICRMGGTAVTAEFDNGNAAFGFNTTNNAPKICPYFDDLWTGTNGKVHFKVTGAAPNRKLIVPLANGASINLRFLLGIQQTGSYRFFINVEALP